MQAKAAIVSHMYFAVGLCVLEPFYWGDHLSQEGCCANCAWMHRIGWLMIQRSPPEKSAGARIGAPTANHQRPDRQPP